MGKKITLQQIARIANVSVGTVHKALHNQKGVSPAKQEEIIALASSLNYYASPPSLAPSKECVVAAVFPKPIDSNRYFYQHLWNGIHGKLQELSAFRFQVQDYAFEGGLAQQLKILQEILDHHLSEIQALITVIWNEDTCLGLLNQFTDAGVKVFTLCADAPSSKRTSTIMTNAYQSGRLAAEYMSALLPGPGRVIIVGTKRDTTNHAQIVRGFFEQMLEDNPLLEIIELYGSVNYPEKLYQTLEEFLTRFPGIRGIYANNARTTAGMCSMLDMRTWEHKPIIVGSELFEESIAYLKKGILHAIIDQNGYQLGYKGISVIFEHMILKKEVRSRYILTQALYLRNNLPETEGNLDF